ncbi:MAG: 50S ribosomal protein L6 [Gammaproteobacteria bacterium]|nr:50S ribosomal protein L6 [Gammaproteobacteria bacterium]
MSRVAKKPVNLPKGVEASVTDGAFVVKGPKGSLTMQLHPSVSIQQVDGVLTMVASNDEAIALAGTTRAIVNNMVIGVSQGFDRRLLLVGVGYRAQAQGNKLNLTLGFSHPLEYEIPEGITIVTPTQTEIVISGTDKQKVGQVAADIRAFRPPEPYKGKGVKYSDEKILRKEAKKK